MKISNFITENDIKNIKKFGIYKIYTTDENICYVGSTTTSFYQRWSTHLITLNKQTHSNIKLKRIVNKYGIQKLVFEIIEVIEDKNIILEKEQYWIDQYDSYKKGYNCTPKAGNCCGKITSDETKKKLSKKVSQYTIDGEYITTFDSISIAAISTGTNKSCICSACKFNNKLANMFQWRYGENTENIGKTTFKNSVRIGQFDDSDNLLNTFLSYEEAGIFNDRSATTMKYSVKTGSKCNGYYWKKI